MDKRQLGQILKTARDISIPAGQVPDREVARRMFQQLRGLASQLMTNLDVNPEIKDIASGPRYGEFNDAVQHIYGFKIYSRGDAPRLQRSLSCIISVLAAAAMPTLDEAIIEVLQGMRGAGPNIDMTEDDIEDRIRKEWPELGFDSGDVAETVRALNSEGLLQIIYSEGVPSLHRIRLPSRASSIHRVPDLSPASIEFDNDHQEVADYQSNTGVPMRFPVPFRWKHTGRTLGDGGQGRVVEVIETDGPPQPTYALKAIASNKPQKAIERFHREITAIKQLEQPNIIKIVDHSVPGASFNFYVMECVEGAVSLQKLMDRGENPFQGGSLRALDLFEQLASAILACEKNSPQILHRDLKPANILVLPNQRSIKIIDFGCCQIADQETITLVDEGVGTPNYMAPECESGGSGEPSVRSDLYSAAKILWAAITNQRAFSREPPAFTTKSMPEMFPNRPETWHLHVFFEMCIRRDPSKRWASARKALDAVQTIRCAISAGRPPLELIMERCGVCGVGILGSLAQARNIFHNPMMAGYVALECGYCGHCVVVNQKDVRSKLEARKHYE